MSIERYNAEFNMEKGTSLSLIVDMVKNDSIVLEIGPAYGRLTRHLKESKNCIIDIVEIDDEAGATASKYARTACIGLELGDITKDKWKNILYGRKYDYIIFADVLEHLSDPEKVLRECRDLMQNNGSILLSVPNLAHNSVIIELLNNNFEYRELGLLDRTHIHFFTYNSLVSAIDRANYFISREEATFRFVEDNELETKWNDVDIGVSHYLRNREYGNVYQFIFEIKKHSVGTQLRLQDQQIDRDDFFQIYFDLGEGYSEENSYSFAYKGSFNQTIEIPKKTCGIRIDPSKSISTIENFSVLIDGKPVQYNILSGTKIDNILIFYKDDPKCIITEEIVGAKKISVKGKKIFTEYFWLCNLIDEQYRMLGKEEKERRQQEYRIEEQRELIRIQKEQNENQIKSLQNQEEIIKKQKDYLKKQADCMHRQIETNQKLKIEIKEKKEKLFSVNESLEHYKEHYLAAINQRTELTNQVKMLTQANNIILNSTCWKMIGPLRGMMDWLKKVVRKNRYLLLFFKGLKSLLRDGVKVTWQRMKNRKQRIEISKIALRDLYSEEDLEKQRKEIFPQNIKFSIVVPLYNTSVKYLSEMIESVQAQTYSNWELCLADGSDSEHKAVGKICRQYMGKDHRVKYEKLKKNKGISGNTNAAMEMVSGDYIGLLDHDDLLHPAALYENMKAICEKNADFIYTDENTFSKKPEDAYCPNFKPDYAPDTLRTNNYICHFSVFKKSLQEEVGGFRSCCDGSQDYDMVLRLTERAEHIVHIPKVLYYWRAHPESVASGVAAKPYVIEAAHLALREHLERVGLEGEVEDTSVPSMYRIKYKIKGNPMISIVIPNKDHIDDLKKCITSVLEKTTYGNYEVIIVENNSTEQETWDYYNEIRMNKRIHIVEWESKYGSFNYPAINNYGVDQSKGEYIVLLNNDTEIITPEWLEEMLMFAQRNDVGAVGGKLIYPDNTIQHGGVGMGILTLAGHYHRGFHRSHPGYMGRLIIAQNLSAVTAACMMIPKKIWTEVDGLDESFKVAFNDIDLCMRIRKKGYLIVWTPMAELYHYESKTRGAEDTPEKQERFASEVRKFQSRWKKELIEGDPYYNPNFTLDREDFSMK